MSTSISNTSLTEFIVHHQKYADDMLTHFQRRIRIRKFCDFCQCPCEDIVEDCLAKRFVVFGSSYYGRKLPKMLIFQLAEVYLPPHHCMVHLGFGFRTFYINALKIKILERSYAISMLLEYSFENFDTSSDQDTQDMLNLTIGELPVFPQTSEKYPKLHEIKGNRVIEIRNGNRNPSGWCIADIRRGWFIIPNSLFSYLLWKDRREGLPSLFRFSLEKRLWKSTEDIDPSGLSDPALPISYRGVVMELSYHPFSDYFKVFKLAQIEFDELAMYTANPISYMNYIY